jgi:hypothetical protein
MHTAQMTNTPCINPSFCKTKFLKNYLSFCIHIRKIIVKIKKYVQRHYITTYNIKF